jgi:RNA polymerase sigma factor (sigma-70 family)
MVDSPTLSLPCPTLHVNPKDRLTRCFLEVREELLRFLTRRTGRSAAEDVLQDVWLNLREGSDPETWREPRAVLFTTAANLATDVSRRNATVEKHFSSDALNEDAVCPRADPESQADANDSLERLHAALMELPQACRDAFLLNRIEALTHVEVAARLGISTKSVQRYIERALRHCVRVLDP